MNLAAALVWGFGATVVLTTMLRASQALGLTRIDLPFIIGSALTPNRDRAKALGYGIHLLNGWGFALVYCAAFETYGEAGLLLGLLIGLVHGAFAAGALLNLLLPAVHPRMGRAWTDARETPILEPPGFLLANYGRSTMAVAAVLHVAYGAIVGLFASL